MKIRVTFCLVLLAVLARPGYSAEAPSAADLAEAMRQASYSDGFEARMNIVTVNADGQRGTPIKLAVIGQFGPETQRLLIRGIAPNSVRNRFVAAERHADGWIGSLEYGALTVGAGVETNPFAKLFDTELVIWDLFGPWWHWPKQQLDGSERIAGRDCMRVRSQSDAERVPIREVVSCVDPVAGLALRTQLFDGHRLLRTISVTRMVGKESGAMAAKALSVAGADPVVSEAELYSGDEHYAIGADTFPAFGSQPTDRK